MCREEIARAIQKRCSLRGQSQGSRCAGDKPAIKRLFQALEFQTHGRLCRTQNVRRSGKAAEVRYVDEGADSIQVQS